MRKTMIVAAILACAVPLGAMQNAQQAAPPKTEQPKPQASLAGKWSLTTVTQNGPLVSTLDLKQDGKKLSGTVASQMGEAPVSGEYADGKLTFSITMQTANGALDITFTGALKPDGTLAGTLGTSSGMTLDWTAERVPDPSTPQDKPAAKPVGISGKWSLALDIAGVGPATTALELKQEGEKITGTYTGRYGTFPLEGTLKARTLTFGFTMNADGTAVAMSFTGEVAPDDQSMKGTATMTGLGDATWTATRAKEGVEIAGLTFGGSAAQGALALEQFCCPAYVELLMKNIAQQWRNRGTRGITRVEFTVERDGRITRVAKTDSSGNVLQDVEAVRAVRSLNMPPLPQEYTNRQLVIRLAFNHGT